MVIQIKKPMMIVFVVGVILLVAALSLNNTIGFFVYPFQSNGNLKMGFCPTMQAEAETIAAENGYELIEFSSASEVLSALSTKDIEIGLIGRKALRSEIPAGVKEEILEAGYVLVSNQKLFFEFSELRNINIHTQVPEEHARELFPEGTQIYYYASVNSVFNRINEGKVVLIEWREWQDYFELVVVNDGNVKAKEFTGVFLYTWTI